MRRLRAWLYQSLYVLYFSVQPRSLSAICQPHKRSAHLVTTLDILSGLAGDLMVDCPLAVASRFGGRVSWGDAKQQTQVIRAATARRQTPDGRAANSTYGYRARIARPRRRGRGYINVGKTGALVSRKAVATMRYRLHNGIFRPFETRGTNEPG